MRPSGVMCAQESLKWGASRLVRSTSIAPGATQLTRMP